jgi:hypothetical protein
MVKQACCSHQGCSSSSEPDGSNSKMVSSLVTSKMPKPWKKRSSSARAQSHPRSGLAFTRLEGNSGRDHHAKHQSRSPTLGLGLCNDRRLPPPNHRHIGRWNPQTRPTLRGVTGKRYAPSTVWVHAHTWLCRGNRCCHHRV